MAEHPVAPDGELRERHADLEGDARLFGKHGHRPEALEHGKEGIEDRAHLERAALEMRLQWSRAAGMALIGIGEGPPAAFALPERTVLAVHWRRLGAQARGANRSRGRPQLRRARPRAPPRRGTWPLSLRAGSRSSRRSCARAPASAALRSSAPGRGMRAGR